MVGGHYFWLGASADAETGSSSLRSPEPLQVSAHTGDDPARYAVAKRVVENAYAVVLDNARNGEWFCLIDPSECVGGITTALARAQDIADIFNGAKA
jgi:hypothetical protein